MVPLLAFASGVVGGWWAVGQGAVSRGRLPQTWVFFEVVGVTVSRHRALLIVAATFILDLCY